ncbi:YihY/virulence factor BrkB family protein [Bacillaceae bacterium SIJ1]|uniref:YihY/virulence factor BrkB family protein n=1 Tax=Litoribacterium kuwaitense TaxID=1398745 RepID=UPI0013EDCEF0|nr:YihY/virulence factor BrkB family protein [Litoribacterium kuwaitense]NGP46053.1 YihY/virulence factor BrkB family protein [Litoribacterium kuwaitense]
MTFLKDLFVKISEDELPALAASLSYFFLLSIFPFLIFAVTLLAYLPLDYNDVFAAISSYAPGDTLDFLETNLEGILASNTTSLLSVGIIGALWSASLALNGLMRALNRAYEVEENRSFLYARSLSIVLTIGMFFVLIVALLLPVFGKEIGVFLFSYLNLSDEFLEVWALLRWGFSSAIIFIVFSFLFWTAPNLRLSYKDVLPGAAFSAIGWQFSSLAFAYYVNNINNYQSTYGSLGGVIVLMVWLYISGLVILVGGEINALLRRRRQDQVEG